MYWKCWVLEKLTCRLCCIWKIISSLIFSQDWRQLEQDLWRLETWLSHARATLRNQRAVPGSMEQLEDAIAEHREFLMDLGRRL